MRQPLRSSRYLVALGVGTLVIALAMAALLVFEWQQRNSLANRTAFRTDSVEAMAYQTEREFMRLRATLDAAVNSRVPPTHEEQVLRYELFQSRLTLLRDNPSVSVLEERPEYRALIPMLDEFVRHADKVLAMPQPDNAALNDLLARLNQLGPDVQALTAAATSSVARRLEQQESSLAQQSSMIMGLTMGLTVLLLAAVVALALRHRQQEEERFALEQLNAELKEARFKAEAANRAKSQFLANMSHELRTPFNGLMGMLSLIETSGINEQQADFVRTAQVSAQHLLALLNDILDISALESGKLTLNVSPASIEACLQDMERLQGPLASSKGLTLVVQRPDSGLPMVRMDATRLKQILFNLVGNAIKFTDRGRVVVVLECIPLQPGWIELRCMVSDTGIGMDQGTLERLFQRFFQADADTNRRYGGTGLGLEISQSLARLMGGAINVASTPGQGSTFTLRVPMELCADAPLRAEAASPRAPSGGAAPQGPAAVPSPLTPTAPAPPAIEETADLVAAARILVVEDHAINRKLVGMLLERMGCVVTFCEDGEQAVAVVQQQPFDAILMDVNMPVMDGLTATRRIRAMAGALAEIPIVVFTADVMNEARERASQAGANDFLPKPVQISELRTILQKHVRAPLRG